MAHLYSFERYNHDRVTARRAPALDPHIDARQRSAKDGWQIAVVITTMDYSGFDFMMEISSNMLAFFLNFPFWKAVGAEHLRLDAVQLDRCLDRLRKTWSFSTRPADLLEVASCTD